MRHQSWQDILPRAWQETSCGEVTAIESLVSKHTLGIVDATIKWLVPCFQEDGSGQKDQEEEETCGKDHVNQKSSQRTDLVLSRPLSVGDGWRGDREGEQVPDVM